MQNMFFMIYLSWPCKDSFGEITKQKGKVVLNKLKLTRFSVTCANSSRATSDLKVWSFLYWAWVPSRPWLFVTENGWLPAYWEMFNKNLSFLLWFITCIPVLHMTAWAPLLKKVGEKSCDMAELSGVQGRVGGVMLHEEVGESVELGGRLRHPLKRFDVADDEHNVPVQLPPIHVWPSPTTPSRPSDRVLLLLLHLLLVHLSFLLSWSGSIKSRLSIADIVKEVAGVTPNNWIWLERAAIMKTKWVRN